MSINLSFKHKILILLATCIILLSLGLSFVMLNSLGEASWQIGKSSKKILSNQTELFLRELVREQALTLDFQVDQIESAVSYGALFITKYLESYPETYLPDKAFFNNILPKLMEKNQHIKSVYFIAKSKQEWIYPAPKANYSGDQSIHKSFFNEFKEDALAFHKVIWTPIHISEFLITRDIVADAIAPVIIKGKIYGCLGLSFSLTRLVAIFNQHQTIRGSYSFLIDTNYQLIGAPPHGRLELSSSKNYSQKGIIDLSDTDNPKLNELLHAMVLGGSFIEELVLKKNLKYFACHPLENINWRLGLVISVAMATAASEELAEVAKSGAHQALSNMALWAVAFLIFALITAMLLVQHLISPVRKMVAATEYISKGKFDMRLEAESLDEIGLLGLSFNRMAEKIQGMIVSFENINKRLDAKNLALKIEINERKRAEQALKESEQNFRALNDNANDGIIIAMGNGKIVYVNQHIAQMSGYSIKELLNKKFMSLIHPKDLEMVNKRFKLRIAGKAVSKQYEFMIVRKNGRDFPIEATGAKTIWRGQPAIISILRDISERKRAEQKIHALNEELEERVKERTAELEAINSELETFAYSVSHDLRAPLRRIDGFSLALMEDYADTLDDIGRDYLKRMRLGSQRMGHLIDDILKLSRSTRGEMFIEMTDLSEIASEIAENLQKSQPERSVEFIIALGITARADKRLISAVLENIIGNAWKYTSKRDHAKIEFGITQHSEKTAFFVRDNGAGFDMAYYDKLFGAFQRLHHENEFEGTGIGLATVQRIIHRHRGQVWAESKVGEGAVFYFTL